MTTAHDTTDSRVVHRIASSLDGAGYDVTYYTPFEGDAPVDVVSYDGTTVGEVPGIRDRITWAVRLARELADSDYDAYHFHDVELLPVGVVLAFTTDATVIYDVHENVEDVLRHKPIFPEPLRPAAATLSGAVESVLSRFVDGIVAASPDVASHFDGHPEVTVVTNYPRRRWAVETDVPGSRNRRTSEPRSSSTNQSRNGDASSEPTESIEPAESTGPTEPTHSNTSTEPTHSNTSTEPTHSNTSTEPTHSNASTEPAESTTEEIQFVYSGLLSPDRGILTLVDAIDRVPDEYDVSLTLGGKFGSAVDRTQIEGRIAESERTEFVGWLPTLEDVIELFRESDVGLLCFHPDPNKTNAVHRSNKLFQYMAAGIPILVSDIGEWARFVEEVDCGVAVDPEDPDAIATAMCDLADGDETRMELGRNGHAAALERYNWDTQREELLALYERLVGPPTPGEQPTGGPSSRRPVEKRTD